MGAIARELAAGVRWTLDAFHGLLEDGSDFRSRKHLHMEKVYGNRPFLTAEFFASVDTPGYHFRSSVPEPQEDKAPALDASGKLTGKMSMTDVAAAASRRMRVTKRLEDKAKSAKKEFGTRWKRKSATKDRPPAGEDSAGVNVLGAFVHGFAGAGK